jgi:hypothetical protein
MAIGAFVLLSAAAEAIRQFRDGRRNGAGAVGGHYLLVNQITRRTR